jgi:ubiquinone/menaquinone biosynthesis C-methylase UbiE
VTLSQITHRIRLSLALFIVGSSLFAWLSLAVGQNQPTPTKPAPDVPRKTAAPWTGSLDIFEESGREQELRLPLVFRDLKIARGSRVADVGAGGGWLSVRLARQVGASGRVYAEEILPRYVEAIAARARREKMPQIATVLGTLDDPKLLANSVDAVVILNAYHEFEKPLTMLAHLKSAMRPGARLGFIERDTDELRREAERAYKMTGRITRRVDEVSDGLAYTDDHRLALPIVRREAERAGFKFVSSRELGNDKFLLVMEKVR